jgi:hypothetical protein
MAELPLTNHEKDLIRQIQEEVNIISQEVMELSKQLDQTNDPQEEKRLLNKMLAKNRITRERCLVRENLIQDGLNRLKT